MAPSLWLSTRMPGTVTALVTVVYAPAAYSRCHMVGVLRLVKWTNKSLVASFQAISGRDPARVSRRITNVGEALVKPVTNQCSPLPRGRMPSHRCASSFHQIADATGLTQRSTGSVNPAVLAPEMAVAVAGGGANAIIVGADPSHGAVTNVAIGDDALRSSLTTTATESIRYRYCGVAREIRNRDRVRGHRLGRRALLTELIVEPVGHRGCGREIGCPRDHR